MKRRIALYRFLGQLEHVQELGVVGVVANPNINSRMCRLYGPP
jgi:hypothetical protein